MERSAPSQDDVVTTLHPLTVLTYLQHMVRFPAQPLGVGAKWRTTATADEQGMQVKRTTVYEIVAIDDQEARLRVSSSEEAMDHDFKLGHERLRLDQLEAGATAEVRVSRQRVLPQVRVHSEVNARVQPEDGKQGSLAVQQTLSSRSPGVEDLALIAVDDASDVASWRWQQVALCQSLRGARSGPYAASFPSGGKALAGECKDGQPTGVWTAWDEAGHKRAEASFAAGLADGTWTAWRDDGSLLGTFQMNAGSGTVTAWWPDGSKRLEAQFHAGKPSGALTAHFAGGKRHLQGQLVDGYKMGVWTEWSESGELTKQLLFDRACRIIEKAEPGSPAASAGFLPGDLVTDVAGIPVQRRGDMATVLSQAAPGPVRIVVERQGKPRTLTVTPAAKDGEPPRIGVRLTCELPPP